MPWQAHIEFYVCMRVCLCAYNAFIPLGLVEHGKSNSGLSDRSSSFFPFFLLIVACRQATALSCYSTDPRGFMFVWSIEGYMKTVPIS